MATHWVVLVVATLFFSLEGRHAAPADSLAAPCDQNPSVVTPSPPLGPCPSQSIEKAAPAAVPYVLDALDEALGPAFAPPAGKLVPLVPAETPCQTSAPLPLPTPLSFPLPIPSAAFQSPIFSFLSQAQNADPAAALQAVSKILSSALPPSFQAAAAYPASPPAPCAAPATSITYVPQNPPTTLLDTQTLLKLGLLQPVANLAAQPTSVLPLDASTLLRASQPAITLPAESQSPLLTLGAIQPANLGLTQLTPELLAQLTLSAVPVTSSCNPAVVSAPADSAPAALQANFISTVPASATPSANNLEALQDIENSRIGLVRNAWSKLYDPLRRLRTHSLL